MFFLSENLWRSEKIRIFAGGRRRRVPLPEDKGGLYKCPPSNLMNIQGVNVLPSFGFFLVQIASRIGHVARYVPLSNLQFVLKNNLEI